MAPVYEIFYKDYGEGILRPVIPLAIVSKKRFVIYEVLVDSGADSNVLPAEIAEVLGIDITKGEKGELAGITGESRDIYFHYVDIRIGGAVYKDVRIGFVEEMGQFSYGVAGQQGFFDIFVVKFDLVKKEIEVTPRSSAAYKN